MPSFKIPFPHMPLYGSFPSVSLIPGVPQSAIHGSPLCSPYYVGPHQPVGSPSNFPSASPPAPPLPLYAPNVSPPLRPPHPVPVASPSNLPPAPSKLPLHPPSSTPLANIPPPGPNLLHIARQVGLNGGIGAAVAAAIVILVIAVVLICRKRKKTMIESCPLDSTWPVAAVTGSQPQRGYSSSVNTEFLPPLHVVGSRSFSYDQLRLSTNNFSASELLGRGGFGLVYKGKLDDANGTSFVAVKCIAESSRQGDKEFRAEVTIISDLRHRNLVKLKGWCCEHGKFLLVYDYMPNGSLDRLLFNDVLCERLIWERRYSIALGLGSALQYLHDECDNVIIHRDIKSSNVLLDQCFTAKLGDFGLSRQMDPGITSYTTAMGGTRGYMAPESMVGFGKATRETDVYAFGVVLLELVSGKRAVDWRLQQEHDGMLVDWVWQMQMEGRWMEAVDERLRGRYDREQGKRVLMVGLVCASGDPKARPKIRSAVEALRGSAALPLVPLFKPTPTIFLSSPRPAISTSSTSAYSSSSSSMTNYLSPR